MKGAWRRWPSPMSRPSHSFTTAPETDACSEVTCTRRRSVTEVMATSVSMPAFSAALSPYAASWVARFKKPLTPCTRKPDLHLLLKQMLDPEP